MAIGVLSYLNQNNIKAGKEIGVIGFDNTSICNVFSPTISTISQPRYDLGISAFNLTLDKINDLNSLNKSIILPHSLILRESTEG